MQKRHKTAPTTRGKRQQLGANPYCELSPTDEHRSESEESLSLGNWGNTVGLGVEAGDFSDAFSEMPRLAFMITTDSPSTSESLPTLGNQSTDDISTRFFFTQPGSRRNKTANKPAYCFILAQCVLRGIGYPNIFNPREFFLLWDKKSQLVFDGLLVEVFGSGLTPDPDQTINYIIKSLDGTKRFNKETDTWSLTSSYAFLDSEFSRWCVAHHQSATGQLQYSGLIPIQYGRCSALNTPDGIESMKEEWVSLTIRQPISLPMDTVDVSQS